MSLLDPPGLYNSSVQAMGKCSTQCSFLEGIVCEVGVRKLTDHEGRTTEISSGAGAEWQHVRVEEPR